MKKSNEKLELNEEVKLKEIELKDLGFKKVELKKSKIDEKVEDSRKALVFDVKRFAVHDGAGLRTTVFFKGCPLRCKWCQNPEGLSAKKRPIYFKNSCIHCRICEKVSEKNQLEYRDDRPYFNLDYTGNFDKLVKMCPSGAIRYDSEEYRIEELVEKIKEDQVFFRNDGGVTFSGGEPLIQGEFLVEVLKHCKEEGIHTAIETTMYAPLEIIEKVLPYLDLIYIDLKVFDENKHKEFTGVSSKIIKGHIKYVLESEHRDKVIIRTPLIPTMTATEKNVRSIAEFLVRVYPEVKYELLNYKPLAPSKYELVDLEYGLDEDYKMFSKDEMQHFYDIVEQSGLKNLITE